MHRHLWVIFFLLTSSITQARTASMEQIQVPQCLAAHLLNYDVLAENKDFKILNVDTRDTQKISIVADQVHCGRFINVSHRLSPSLKESAQKLLEEEAHLKQFDNTNQYEISHPNEVQPLLAQVDTQQILSTLVTLTQFKNRSALSATGVRAAEWVSDHVGRLIDRSPRSDLDQFTVKTGQRYPQPSLVAVINNESQESAIVIGAHIDTLGGRMPGAGDDGSGSACLLEIARILSQSELEFKRPIYLIWYAAEEQGLVGSQFVVNYFQSHQIPVKAVLQLDMTGFRNNKNDPTIWIYDDNTDEHLNLFLADLMTVYLGIPNAHSSCGYGCSDHASWQAKGIPASFPCETDFEHHNNKIHTAEDTIDRLTPEHMVNFTKLGIAFAVELALS